MITKCLESELRPLVRLRENTRPSVNMATIRLERKNGRNGAEIEDLGGMGRGGGGGLDVLYLEVYVGGLKK